MKSREIVNVISFTKQKYRHRHRKPMYGYQGGKSGWEELRDWDCTYTIDACMLTCILWSYPTLWDTVDHRPTSSSVHGILQARILVWIAMPSSWGSSQPRDQNFISDISCLGRQVLYHRCHLGNPGDLCVSFFFFQLLALLMHNGHIALYTFITYDNLIHLYITRCLKLMVICYREH